MASQGGHGIVFKIDTGTMDVVVNLMDVGFPEQEKFLAEATFHDSSSAYLEYIDTGLRQLTEFEATVAWDSTDSSHDEFITTLAGSAAVSMSIADPLAQETITFDAHVRKVGRVAQSRELYQCVLTVQPTAGPTIT